MRDGLRVQSIIHADPLLGMAFIVGNRANNLAIGPLIPREPRASSRLNFGVDLRMLEFRVYAV